VKFAYSIVGVACFHLLIR